MHSYRFRGASARAYVMAALLALISFCVIAPRAEAHVGHHHWHHHQRHHQYGHGWHYHRHDHFARVNRGWFTEITQGSLFEPPAPPVLVFDQQIIHPAREAVSSLATHATGILREAAKFIGDRNPTGFRGKWCAAFVRMVLERTGHRTVRSMRAIDQIHDGYRVRSPEPGDLAVMRHHVTFFARWGGRGFYGLGGNQGHRVRISNYPIYRVIAWVRPT